MQAATTYSRMLSTFTHQGVTEAVSRIRNTAVRNTGSDVAHRAALPTSSRRTMNNIQHTMGRKTSV